MANPFDHFGRFLLAVGDHTFTLLAGCALTVIINYIERNTRLKGKLTWKHDVCIVLAFVFFACFQAWHDEFKRADALMHPPQQPAVNVYVPPAPAAQVVVEPVQPQPSLPAPKQEAVPNYIVQQNRENASRGRKRLKLLALSHDGDAVVKKLQSSDPLAHEALVNWRKNVDDYLTKMVSVQAAQMFDRSMYGNTDMPMTPKNDIEAVRRQQFWIEMMLNGVLPQVQYFSQSADPTLKADILSLSTDIAIFLQQHPQGCPTQTLQTCIQEYRDQSAARFSGPLQQILARMKKIGFSDEMVESSIRNMPDSGIQPGVLYALRQDAEKIQ